MQLRLHEQARQLRELSEEVSRLAGQRLSRARQREETESQEGEDPEGEDQNEESEHLLFQLEIPTGSEGELEDESVELGASDGSGSAVKKMKTRSGANGRFSKKLSRMLLQSMLPSVLVGTRVLFTREGDRGISLEMTYSLGSGPRHDQRGGGSRRHQRDLSRMGGVWSFNRERRRRAQPTPREGSYQSSTH